MNNFTPNPTNQMQPISSDHAQGPANAPITLIEYGDYECPYCWDTYYTIKTLQHQLGNKLQFIFRNYPRQELHPHAFNASLAVETAGLQGKFWEMYDLVFTHQEALDDASLLQYARDLWLDEVQFLRDFQSQEVLDKVTADILSGDKAEIEVTPTFFINGERYEGNREDENEFLEDLEEML